MALTQTEVSQLYVSLFGRASEGDGNEYWMANSSDMVTAADTMLATEAAREYFGDTIDDNQAFIEFIYLNTLGKTIADDPEGIAYWVAELESGVSQGQVSVNLIVSAQDPGSAGDAQDQFNNKVLVSNDAADKLAAFTTIEAFTAYVADVDHTDASVTAATAAIDADVPVAGETYELTTGSADVVESGTGDDTITGTTLTYQSGDIIVDASTTDSDTFDLTLTAANAQTTTVTNIEDVNVDMNYFTGTAATLDLTNYTASTVTFGSSKLGFNGVSGATKVGANTVIAGSNIDTFTATGVTTGTVDAGSAGTVSVTGTAGVTHDIIVNGDILTGTGLAITTSTKVAIDFTADSSVLYMLGAAGVTTTLTGDNDVTLTMLNTDVITTAAVVDSTEGVITLNVSGGPTFDATNFAVDNILVGDAATQVATVADGQVMTTKADMTSLTVDTTSTDSNAVSLNLMHDVTTLVATDTAGKLDVTINNLDANVIGTLTATGQKVVATGSTALTVSSSDVKTFDASAATGELIYSLAAGGTTQTISGTTGKNTVTLGNVADVVSFAGQSGVDTLDVSALAVTGTVAAELGAGNDVISFDDLGVGATVALDGGTGTDAIKILDGGDLSAMTATGTWAVSGFEGIQIVKAADLVVDTVTAVFYGAMLSGETYAVTTKEAIDIASLTVTANGATTDLSGITVSSDDLVAITGRAAKADTIIGTNGNDTIAVGAGTASAGKTLTGGAGDDVFTFLTTESVEANFSSITDYEGAAGGSDNDTITVVNTNILADDTFDVSGVGTIFDDATATVNAVVSDGILTLSGLAADVALVNTFAEMMDIVEEVGAVLTGADNAVNGTGSAEVFAFEYSGSTYVFSDVLANTTDMVVEIVGQVGFDALDTVAAANTILIA